MELLKYTQNIQKVYEALNLIYNGDIKEDYAGAYNLLIANPLANEMIPSDVFKFIAECARIQMELQNMLGDGHKALSPTKVNGKYRDDVTARELGEGGLFMEEYEIEWNRGPSHYY